MSGWLETVGAFAVDATPRLLAAAVLGAGAWLLECAVPRRRAAAWPVALRAAPWWAVLLVLVVPGLPEASAVAFDREATAPPPWLGVICLATALGTTCVAGRAVWRASRRARRFGLAHAEPVPPRLVRIAAQCARRSGLRRTPRLVVTRFAPGPAVLGVLRPLVVLPLPLACAATRRRLEHVLMHEFAHLARRDPARAALCDVFAVLGWFHPAVRLAVARLRVLRELACDARAVAAYSARGVRRYRDTLVQLAGHAPRAQGALAFGEAAILARVRALRAPSALGAMPSRAAAVLLTAVLLWLTAPRVPLGQSRSPDPDEPGCLRQRYRILAALAQEQANGAIAAPNPDPRPR